MSVVLDLVAAGLAVGGAFFFVAGAVGLVRFPDLHTRLHALTKADNLGLGLLALSVAVHTREVSWALKLGLVWLLAIAAAATVAQLIARAALRHAPGDAEPDG